MSRTWGLIVIERKPKRPKLSRDTLALFPDAWWLIIPVTMYVILVAAVFAAWLSLS